MWSGATLRTGKLPRDTQPQFNARDFTLAEVGLEIQRNRSPVIQIIYKKLHKCKDFIICCGYSYIFDCRSGRGLLLKMKKCTRGAVNVFCSWILKASARQSETIVRTHTVLGDATFGCGLLPVVCIRSWMFLRRPLRAAVSKRLEVRPSFVQLLASLVAPTTIPLRKSTTGIHQIFTNWTKWALNGFWTNGWGNWILQKNTLPLGVLPWKGDILGSVHIQGSTPSP